jgi:ATP-binding cassette subfamily B protein
MRRWRRGRRKEKARRKKKKKKKSAWEQWRALPRIGPYLRPYKKLAAMTVILTVLGSVVGLAEPWPLAMMLDSVLGSQPTPGILRPLFGANADPYELLVFIVGLGFAITVMSHGITVINEYVSVRLQENMIMNLRSDLFEHCQRLSLTFHDQTLTGKLMAKINLQASALGQVTMSFPPLAEAFLTLLGMLVIALLIDWQVTLVSLVIVPFIYYLIGLYGTRIVPQVMKAQSLEWRSLSIVYEAMAMLRVIVSFGRERYEHNRFREQGQTAVDARVRVSVKQTLFSLGVATAIGAGTALVLGFGAWHVLRGDITIGELTVLIAYITSVYQPLEQISITIGNLHQQFVFLNASLKLLDTEPEVKEDPNAIDIERFKGDVTFDKVSFSYEGRTDTLKEISFKAKAGQRIALVGPTGAGKTTLVSLLVRFYDPADGVIEIDGVDVRRLKLSCLREQIAMVLQEPLLFSGTIADNIRYGRLDATEAEIVSAAKSANCHDFISQLPEGYETELGERGAQLSIGERQRICLARAFIRDAPIVILDEPTSSIDSKTENVILDALDDLMVGRTSIMIAHRLATIRDADVILVMEDGQLVEHGSHDELVERGGLYSQLHAAQTGKRKRKVDETALGELAGSGAGTNGHPSPDGDRALPAARDGQELQDQVLESLTQALRRRVRSALQEGGNGDQERARVSALGDEGSELPDEVMESLTEAVRRRVRSALREGSGEQDKA